MASSNSITTTFQRTGHVVRGCPECGGTDYFANDDLNRKNARHWVRIHSDIEPGHHPFAHIEHHEIERMEQT